jgi:ferredoxin/flavodoxin
MLFYFSATGNSLYAAKKIAEEDNEQIFSIPELILENRCEFTLKPGENAGFVIPTYFYGIPTIVADFIEKLKLNDVQGHYVYVVLTCGTTTGNAAEMFARLMKKRGVTVSAKYAVVMVDNYVPFFPLPGKDEQKICLENADRMLADIQQKIAAKKTGDFNTVKGMLHGFGTLIAYPYYKYGRKTKNFHVNDSCNHCGICERNCPVKAIRIVDSKPVWEKEACVLCLACLHRCPKAAIDYRKTTVKSGRYVNPNAGWNKERV